MASIRSVLQIVVALCAIVACPNINAQGALTPPGPPAPTMKTLAQVEPRTIIPALPYTITNPGSYYLTTNLSSAVPNANGITVLTNDVVINLNGFALISGATNTFSGIYVEGSLTNITVRNGSLSGWGASGIDAYSYGPPVNLLFEKLTCSGNAHYGLGTGQSSVVRDCLCQDNGWGGISSVGVANISGCSLVSNTNAGASGLFIFGGDAMIRDCQISRNNYGVVAYGRCDVQGSTVNSNASDGIFISYNGVLSNYVAAASTISRCSIMGNGGNGINMTGGSSSFYLYGSSAMISDCSVVGNSYTGIYIIYSPGSKVANCNVIGNGQSGIYVGGDDSKIVGNNLEGNNGAGNTNYAGIVISANQCLVQENHMNNNSYADIAIKFGTANIVVKNTLSDPYYFGSGNDIGPVSSAASATSPWANIYR